MCSARTAISRTRAVRKISHRGQGVDLRTGKGDQTLPNQRAFSVKFKQKLLGNFNVRRWLSKYSNLLVRAAVLANPVIRPKIPRIPPPVQQLPLPADDNGWMRIELIRLWRKTVFPRCLFSEIWEWKLRNENIGIPIIFLPSATIFIDGKVIYKLEQAPKHRFPVSKFTVYLLKADHRGISSGDFMFSLLNFLNFWRFSKFENFPETTKIIHVWTSFS